MSLVTPSHQGGQSLASLELLANPDRLQQRIDAFKQSEESAREQIALAGPASEILKIRAEIGKLKADAEEALNDAHDQCEALISGANDQAEQIVDKATQQAVKLKGDAENLLQKAEALSNGAVSENAVVQREKSVLQARESELGNKEEVLQQKADALDGREQELKEMSERFAKLRDLIHKNLS